MHVIDAGPDETLADCCMARFRCVHCDEETDWIQVTITEAKRGIPCPKCNQEAR